MEGGNRKRQGGFRRISGFRCNGGTTIKEQREVCGKASLKKKNDGLLNRGFFIPATVNDARGNCMYK